MWLASVALALLHLPFCALFFAFKVSGGGSPTQLSAAAPASEHGLRA